MKKFLLRIFSVGLAAATSVGPIMAQYAKKASGASATQPKATITMKVQAKPEKSKSNRRGFLTLPKKGGDSSGIRTARPARVSRPVNVKLAEGATVPTMYGYVNFNDKIGANSASKGFYELPTQAGAEGRLISSQIDATGGGVLIDGVYHCVKYQEFWGMLQIDVCAYDFETGELLYSHYGDVDNIAVGGFAFDPTTQNVYGIGYTADGNGFQLAKYEFGESAMNVTPIAQLTESYNSIVVDNSGQLYGISFTGHTEGQSVIVDNSSLKKLDKTTGEATLVADLGVAPQYLSSATVDPKTNRCYWNVCTADGNAYIYEVDLAAGTDSPLFQLALNDEIFGMVIPGPEAQDGAPGACENVSLNFENGSLAGKVRLTTPSTLFDGSAGSGELVVTVLVNGEQMGCVDAGWGETVDVDVDMSLPGPGQYDFKVFASNEVGMGPKTRIDDVWLGPDTPEATKTTLVYANGNMELSWLPVETTINGGYLDLDNLTYTIKDWNDQVVAEGLTTTSYTQAVPEPDEVTMYYYSVYAVCGELVSAPGRSNSVVLGSITPPYTPDFAADGLAGYTNIDSDGDGKLWTLEGANLMHTYNSSAPIDDWLITPPLKLEAGKAYLVTFDYWNNGTVYNETLEVKWGDSNTVEAMTNTILPETNVTGGSDIKTRVEYYLTPSVSGKYFIGFHSLSAPDQYNLFVGNFSVSGDVSSEAPGAPADIRLSPAEFGGLTNEIYFRTPDTTMAGDELTSLTKVEVYRGESLIKTFESPAIGSEIFMTDEVAQDGEYNYTIVGYNEKGRGIPAYAACYVGTNLPAGVISVSIARTDVLGQAVATWDAVTTDINGRPLRPDQVTYEVYDYTKDTPVLLADIPSTSYSYQVVEPGSQDFAQIAVFPKTKVGVGEGASTNLLPVGTPYNGLYESFAGYDLHYIWGRRAIIGGSVTVINDERFDGLTSQDDDNGFLTFISINPDGGADFFSGLISLEGIENPGISFYTYNIKNEDGDVDINELSVSVKELGQTEWVTVLQPTSVDELCGGEEGWKPVHVSLDAYANKTIEVQLTGITKFYAYTPVDNIRVGSMLNEDLSASRITGPGTVKPGSEYNIDVRVVNQGLQTAGAFSVELYADESLVATENIGGLSAGASTTVSFKREMSPLATESVSYYAKVVYASDENADNNQTSSVEVTPVVSKLPKASGLAATNVAEGIELTWNEPDIEAGMLEEITEDFEDGDAFAAEYGDWTFVDADQSPVGGFQGLEVPGIVSGTTLGSFWIWDHSQLGNKTLMAHSGEKYLFALFRYDNGSADDWAISPLLPGMAQTISFYARSYSAENPEKITVYYSTGSKDPADFVAIEDATFDPVVCEWTQYSVELPEGAKYFAIRSYATGGFMLMVDDVTFTPALLTYNLEIAGYNVYRDGVMINSELLAECSYLDANVVDGTHYTYVVTVVYTGSGESAASEEVAITRESSGVGGIGDGLVGIKVLPCKIVVTNADGRKVTVSAANGAVIYDSIGDLRTEVAVGPGVYIVSAGNTVRKVIVR